MCFEFLLKRTLTLSNSKKHLLNFKGMEIRSRHRYWSDCENSFWKFKWPPILMKLVSIERSQSQCELLWRKLSHISNTRIYENRRTHESQSETSPSPGFMHTWRCKSYNENMLGILWKFYDEQIKMCSMTFMKKFFSKNNHRKSEKS